MMNAVQNLFKTVPSCTHCKHFMPPKTHHITYGKCARLQRTCSETERPDYMYAIIARDFECIDGEHFEHMSVKHMGVKKE